MSQEAERPLKQGEGVAGLQISVVICTHNRYDLCKKALNSLIQQQEAAENFEIIVVDNSNSKNAADNFAKSFRERPIVFLHTTAIGLSNARNIGARAASGNVIAYLDDDAIAAPGWVRAIAKAFEACGARAGAIGGPVRPIWVEPSPPWMNDRFLEIFAIIDRGPTMRTLDEAEWLAGCNIAFARDALLEVGGFDVGLGRIGGALLSNEETAVCDRIRKLGRDVIYAPDVVVSHIVPPVRATAQFVRRRVAWQAASDALTDPQRAADHAARSGRGWGAVGRLLKAARFYRVMHQRRRAISRRDYDFVYDLVNQLLCFEDR